MNTALDAVLLLLMFATGWLALLLRHRHAVKRLNAAKYHAHGDAFKWGKTSLLGRKEMRVCPDCATMAHDWPGINKHAEYHQFVDLLADRLTAVERLLAEERGGGPVEEPAPVPWDGLSGELVEHAGAVDVAAGEIEARADEPEPEQVRAFREKYGHLIGGSRS